MKKIYFIVILLIYLCTQMNAQNRRETEILRHTDTSRQREEPAQNEHQRHTDESGKIREIPRIEPPQRESQRWIDNGSEENSTSYQVPNNVSYYDMDPVYITGYDVVEEISAEVYIPETKIIYTSEKEQAMNLMKNGWYDSAIKLLTASIAKNSKDLELYFLRGIAEIRAEYYKDAIEDLNYYLKFFNDDGEGYYMRGLAKFLDLDKQEAQKDFILATDLKCQKAKQILKKYY